MITQLQAINRLRSICLAIVMALIFLWLSAVTIGHSTAKTRERPIQPSFEPVFRSTFSQSIYPVRNTAISTNPLAPAFIQAIPGSDGQEIFVSVNEVNVAGSPTCCCPNITPDQRIKPIGKRHWEQTYPLNPFQSVVISGQRDETRFPLHSFLT